MSGPEPFVFGPFSVDSEGRLSPAHADLSPGFSVRWRGLTVHARLTGAAPLVPETARIGSPSTFPTQTATV